MELVFSLLPVLIIPFSSCFILDPVELVIPLTGSLILIPALVVVIWPEIYSITLFQLHTDFLLVLGVITIRIEKKIFYTSHPCENEIYFGFA